MQIICGIADALFGSVGRDDPSEHVIDWAGMARDYSTIRRHIAHVVPGFHAFEERVAHPGGFQLPNAARDSLEFETSTQNLGNIPKVELAGWDLDLTGRITDELSVNAGFGYTSSVVKEFPGLSALVVGTRAPLVSDYTANIGVQFDHDLGDGFSFHSRLDYNRIGDTTFAIPVLAEPVPIARRPVDLVDLRIGFEKDSWSATFWSRNLFDKQYNTEYSTGGFLFKADGRQLGVDLTKRF